MNLLLSQLVKLTIDHNDKVERSLDVIITDLDEKLIERAKDGFTTHMVFLTCNPHCSSDNTDSTIIHANNDIALRLLAERITKHYADIGLEVYKRYNDDRELQISWNKNVLDHYGYEF